MKKISILFCIGLAFSISTLAQTDGTLDSTFNGTGILMSDNGFHDIYNDVRIQDDQKIVASGVSLNSSYVGRVIVDRWMTDGSPDTTFGVNGRATHYIGNDSYGYDSYILNNGKILVAGCAYGHLGGFAAMILRLNSDGSIDTSFGSQGATLVDISTSDDFASAMAVQPDGKILISGTYTDTLFHNVPMVMRFSEEGEIDTSFGVNGRAEIPVTGTDNELTSISVMQDGRIIAAGHYETAFTFFDVLLIRFHPDGTLDSTFGTNGFVIQSLTSGIEDCFGMELADNGKIVITGFTTLPDYSFDLLVMQFDSTGVLDNGFGTGGAITFNNGTNDVGLDVYIQNDHKILICGTSGGDWANDRDFLLMRYTQNGIPDSTFGTNGIVYTQMNGSFDEANAMTLQADGKIVLAGKANDPVGGNLDFALARYQNGFSTRVPEIITEKSLPVFPNGVHRNATVRIPFSAAGSGTIQWISPEGKCVAGSEWTSATGGKSSLEIPVPSELNAGVYFIRCVNSRASYTGKVIVQ